MKLIDVKTAAGLAGILVGGGLFVNGFYFIDSVGKPLILTGSLVTLASIGYLIFHFQTVPNNSTVHPDDSLPSV